MHITHVGLPQDPPQFKHTEVATTDMEHAYPADELKPLSCTGLSKTHSDKTLDGG